MMGRLSGGKTLFKARLEMCLDQCVIYIGSSRAQEFATDSGQIESSMSYNYKYFKKGLNGYHGTSSTTKS